MITGLNHLTIAVSDLERSFTFYTQLVGMTPKVKWATGAYLTLDQLWFCLAQGKVVNHDDYCHIAFDIAAENFEQMKQKLLKAGVTQWQENNSEGDSFYFTDPDNNKLELHVGSLASRLNSLKITPYKQLQWY